MASLVYTSRQREAASCIRNSIYHNPCLFDGMNLDQILEQLRVTFEQCAAGEFCSAAFFRDRQEFCIKRNAKPTNVQIKRLKKTLHLYQQPEETKHPKQYDSERITEFNHLLRGLRDSLGHALDNDVLSATEFGRAANTHITGLWDSCQRHLGLKRTHAREGNRHWHGGIKALMRN